MHGKYINEHPKQNSELTNKCSLRAEWSPYRTFSLQNRPIRGIPYNVMLCACFVLRYVPIQVCSVRMRASWSLVLQSGHQSRPNERDLPYMMSASEGEGGHGKADVVGEVALILYYKSDPNADKGRGSKNPKSMWTSYLEALG